MPAAPSSDPSPLPSSDPELSLVDEALRLALCRDDMVLVEFLVVPEPGHGSASASAPAANRSVRALMRQLAHDPLPFVMDQVAGVTTLAVRLTEAAQRESSVQPFLSALHLRARQCLGVDAPKGKTVVLHACFDAEFAPDLVELAQTLGRSPRQLIDAVLSTALEAEVVGFMPGFAYLRGLPADLAPPRRRAPRPAVPAGSVAIAGGQAAVYPTATPGGWNLIGRCPDLLFAPDREEPTLIGLGDRVQFREISRTEFEARWAQR